MTGPIALLTGLQVTLIGMVIVFVALIALVYIFKLMSALVKILQPKENVAIDLPTAVVSSPAVLSSPAIVAAAPALANNDQEVVAVISAAVAAMAQDQQIGLVVRSVRHIGTQSPAWNTQGRIDILQSQN